MTPQPAPRPLAVTNKQIILEYYYEPRVVRVRNHESPVSSDDWRLPASVPCLYQLVYKINTITARSPSRTEAWLPEAGSKTRA